MFIGKTIPALLKIQLIVVLSSLFLISCKTEDTIPFEDPAGAVASSGGNSTEIIVSPLDMPRFVSGWKDSTFLHPLVDGNNLYVPVSGGFNPLKVFSVDDKILLLECTECQSTTGYRVEKYHDRLVMAGLSDKGYATLEIIDTSNSAVLRSIAFIEDKTISRNAHAMHYTGRYALIAYAGGYIQIYDLDKLSNIKLVASLSLGDSGEGVDISDDGNTLYIANGSNGLHLYNITDITTPTFITTIAVDDFADQVLVDSNRLYISDWNNGFQIYDITNPVTPGFLGKYDTIGKTFEVFVSGNFLFAADTDQGIEVFDISTPATPVLVNTLDAGATNTHHIQIANNTIYATDSTMGVRQADITTPGTAVHSGVDLPASGERVDGLDIVGNIAYQAITGNGFAIVDITDPTAPKDLGSFTKGPNNCHGVHVVGNYAYLAYGGYGLVILDISNPKNPVEVGSIDPGAYSVDVKVQGSYAYLANDDNVQIIDITDPMNPSIAFVIGTTNHTYDLAVDGNRLLIGEKTSGLTIYDISDPTLPILKSTTAPKNTISTVVIKNNLAYVSDGTFGLRIFDISNLAAPKEVGSLPSIDMVGDILIDGNKLYASTSVGIGVYTLDNPIAPISMGSFQAGFTIAYELIVRGNYLHIANKTGGYKVFTK